MSRKTISIDKKSKIAELIQFSSRNNKEIAAEAGTCPETVRKIRMQLITNDKVFRESLEAEQKQQTVKKLLEEGYSWKQICEQANVSKSYVIAEDNRKQKEERLDEEKESVRKKELEKWLAIHWRWKNNPRIRRRFNPETGLRIVYKGERGKLRTPYRPDRIWR